MFKKFKDKLAEEVKSSPQRIHQFAQAAQAAVTSASSSISDITNTDLFSIGDNDGQQGRLTKAVTSTKQTTFQDINLQESTSVQNSIEPDEYSSNQDIMENQRQRRFSNSSFASDVSFRLPNYDSPSMYHLQSDIEISASEAEERGFSSGAVSLDRVTKEQIYAAYKRTQERYSKYRTQYADLARHYKLLERENAKARSVLVETQDKALRRISELREQCSLEQSAKAHLEKALRVDIEERNIKIQTLQTQIQLLQSNNPNQQNNENDSKKFKSEEPLINLLVDNNENKQHESLLPDVNVLNNKIEKMEQLVNKYKDSLKQAKEKNNQLTTEVQLLSTELENKRKENDSLVIVGKELTEARERIQDLNDLNEELQNKINAFEFTKTKHHSTLEVDLQKAQDEIKQLQLQVAVLTKREEENAISLAENKLSIHKELESKEKEIKSLKESLAATHKEIQSLNIVVDNYKSSVSSMEDEKTKLCKKIDDLNMFKNKATDLELQLKALQEKYQFMEISKSKVEEEFKCMQLQLKQETAEKLAMIDRNGYLENRNTQLSDENTKKSLQINQVEEKLCKFENIELNRNNYIENEKVKLQQEILVWKGKYSDLESEIQEEREELVKLQSEIEKLLSNHEKVQIENNELKCLVKDIEAKNTLLQETKLKADDFKVQCIDLHKQIKEIKELIVLISQDTKIFTVNTNENVTILKDNFKLLHNYVGQIEDIETVKTAYLAAQEKVREATDNLTKYQRINSELNSAIQSLTSENSQIKINLNELQNQYQGVIDELHAIKEENQKINEKLKVVANETINKNSTDEGKMALIEQERQASIETIKSMQKENELITEEFANLKKNNEEYIAKLNYLSGENEKFVEKIDIIESEKTFCINNLESNIKLLTEENIQLKNNVELLSHKVSELEFEKRKLIDDKEKQDLVKELDNLKRIYQDNLDQLNILTEENCDLLSKTKTIESDKNSCIESLNNEIQMLKQENISLQKQTTNFANNLKHLETDLSDLRDSHAEIEKEKDHLSSVIKKFEGEAEIVSTNTQHTKTINNTLEKEYCEVDSQTIDVFVDKVEDINEFKHENVVSSYPSDSSNAQHDIEDDSKKMLSNKDILNQYFSLKENYNAQKEENRRLKSDIAGLQTHLTKISKENSSLNDKLRVMIASGDNSNDRDEDLTQAYDKELLRNEENLSKIDNLIRENTLLIDENLELKEQLYSQNHEENIAEQTENIKETDYLNLKTKYNSLMETKLTLQKRLSDLEHLNNAANNNVLQMQDNIQKLRLTNEKLETRLDEALVSLRHLHSLQENTELEYLKNILYEYLTGSGTHSVTLAKVLSAVVKFDDSQTQQVLQKEKERQGFEIDQLTVR